MRLPRTLRLDQSDLHVFEHACAPGEWAIPGGFVFADVDAARLEGKAQLAFRSGWLGLDSFGHATFVEVAEIAEPDFFQLVRSEEHTSELQSLMRNSYAVFCLKKKTNIDVNKNNHNR